MEQRAKQIILLVGDAFSLYVSLVLMIFIIQKFNFDFGYFYKHVIPFTIIFPTWLIVYFIEGMYSLRTFNANGLSVSIIRSQIINLINSFIFFYLITFEGISPKSNLLIFTLITTILLFIWRKLFFKLFSMKGLKLKTILLASTKSNKDIVNHLKNKPYLGFEIIETKSDLSEISEEAQLIVIDKSYFNGHKNLKELIEKMNESISFIDFSRFTELITGKVPVYTLDENWFIDHCGNQSNRLFQFTKNTFDKFTASIIAILVSPVYLILIPLLLIFSGRPIFYTQTRIGLRNKPFKIYKLRTMIVDSEKNGIKWAQPNDTRVTPIGKFLRKSRLDEIPQVWNILKGDMSIVGPRPERPEIINTKLSRNIPYYNFRHLVKPGVTGWAQVHFRYGYSQDDSLTKLQYDLYYLKYKSIWLDIKILLKTIKTIITGVGH